MFKAKYTSTYHLDRNSKSADFTPRKFMSCRFYRQQNADFKTCPFKSQQGQHHRIANKWSHSEGWPIAHAKLYLPLTSSLPGHNLDLESCVRLLAPPKYVVVSPPSLSFIMWKLFEHILTYDTGKVLKRKKFTDGSVFLGGWGICPKCVLLTSYKFSVTIRSTYSK
jgi:hypothetical protein